MSICRMAIAWGETRQNAHRAAVTLSVETRVTPVRWFFLQGPISGPGEISGPSRLLICPSSFSPRSLPGALGPQVLQW